MKRAFKKKLRLGSAAIAVTVLVLCAVIAVNVIAAMLSSRYEWMYPDMNTDTVYSISDECRDYVEDFIIPEVEGAEGAGISIIFCDTQENIKADERLVNIYASVKELASIFPEHIEIKHINVWEDPSLARYYGVTSTGDIVCEFDGRHETVNYADFYITDPEDDTVAIAYNGEKILSSCLLRVTMENAPMCYFTVNHGENIEDGSLMRIMIEAGYTVSFLDLSAKDIPSDCELLITYEPERDMSRSASGEDETQRLDEYMRRGGRYMVLLNADTFASGGFDNLEGLLADWGVEYAHKTANDGIEQSYLIRDTANSLTVDGYTVLGTVADNALAQGVLADASYPVAFGKSTCISIAEGFVPGDNGKYTRNSGGSTVEVSPLVVTHNTAEAWMGGIAAARADENPFMLMTLSSCENNEGETGYLVACASTEMASKMGLYSAVLGNGRMLTEVVRYMGRENAPVSLTFKTFSGTTIESLTTSDANTYTVLFALLPTLAVAACGSVILIRRRYL